MTRNWKATWKLKEKWSHPTEPVAWQTSLWRNTASSRNPSGAEGKNQAGITPILFTETPGNVSNQRPSSKHIPSTPSPPQPMRAGCSVRFQPALPRGSARLPSGPRRRRSHFSPSSPLPSRSGSRSASPAPRRGPARSRREPAEPHGGRRAAPGTGRAPPPPFCKGTTPAIPAEGAATAGPAGAGSGPPGEERPSRSGLGPGSVLRFRAP